MVIMLTSSGVDCGFKGQTKDYNIGICCFTAELMRRKDWLVLNQDNVSKCSSSKDWFVLNQDNVSKCSDMFISGLLFQ